MNEWQFVIFILISVLPGGYPQQAYGYQQPAQVVYVDKHKKKKGYGGGHMAAGESQRNSSVARNLEKQDIPI